MPYMDTLMGQLIALLVVIALILFVILRFKLDASMTLVIASVVLGLIVGVPLTDLAGTITGGFGSMMAAIGLSIGFGIMLGQLLSDSGGAYTIADRIVRLFPAERAVYALSLAAFVLSIPVFFDVTFVILIPIGLAVLQRTGKSIAHLVGALSIGAGLAHMLVPPTPAPLAAGEIFGFDVGLLIAIGVPLGLVAVPTSTWLYCQLLDRAILRWHPDTDIANEPTVHVNEHADESARRPGLFVSLLPILVPLGLILATTVAKMLGEAPIWLGFIGDKTIAMLLGAVTAYAVAARQLGGHRASESVGNSLGALGTVLLVTGAGGAFAAIIGASGISKSIASAVGGADASPIVLVVLAFGTGVLLRVATGSGTVAALTSMPIIAAAGAGSITPLPLLALACLAGSLAGSTVNDSGFWIVTKLSGFEVSGGIKAYTVPVAISSLVVFVILLGWSVVVQLTV